MDEADVIWPQFATLALREFVDKRWPEDPGPRFDAFVEASLFLKTVPQGFPEIDRVGGRCYRWYAVDPITPRRPPKKASGRYGLVYTYSGDDETNADSAYPVATLGLAEAPPDGRVVYVVGVHDCRTDQRKLPGMLRDVS